ncbi:MAG: hypothetical protein II767_08750 [Proteobacteria bacterium]|nr:hypothetical protein [Pseudomonadota bacterium]
MAINIVEKNALALNQILRTDGKRLGKEWRLRVRTLLGETFAALNAKPLDGALCLQLSEKIDAELAALAEMKRDDGEDDGAESGFAPAPEKSSSKKKKSRKKAEAEDDSSAEQTSEGGAENTADAWWAQETEAAPAKKKKSRKKDDVVALSADAAEAELPVAEDARESASEERSSASPCIGAAENGEEAARIGAADSDEEAARIAEGDSGASELDITAGELVRQKATEPEEVGLFDLIHVQIRCFFKINACVRPPYIGKFVQFADKFSEVREARIERFIRVLSKGDEEITMKTEVEVGYRDDLIKDMPEMGFVLHPKKKKKR